MQSATATDYAAVVSPRNRSADDAQQYARLTADTEAAISSFHQSTRAIMQKMLVLGTAQDSTANHQELRELTDEGNALVGRVQRSLHELRALSAALSAESPTRRRHTAEVDALASDFQSQCWNFEDTCRRLIEGERAAVAHIRQHASRRDDDFGASDAATPPGRGLDLANYDEETKPQAPSSDQDGQSSLYVSDALRCACSPLFSTFLVLRARATGLPRTPPAHEPPPAFARSQRAVSRAERTRGAAGRRLWCVTGIVSPVALLHEWRERETVCTDDLDVRCQWT